MIAKDLKPGDRLSLCGFETEVQFVNPHFVHVVSTIVHVEIMLTNGESIVLPEDINLSAHSDFNHAERWYTLRDWVQHEHGSEQRADRGQDKQWLRALERFGRKLREIEDDNV